MRNPFRRQSEADKRITAVRADLRAARDQLAGIDAEEALALEDSAAFAAWSQKRAAAASEVDRLERLTTVAENAATEVSRSEADAAAHREIAAARKEADDLANRVRTDGARIMGELLSLSKECAKQSLAAKALNERLPEGETPVPLADIAARDFGTAPREEVAKRTVELWVAETTGVIVGDQDAVTSEDGVHGQVHVFGGTMRWKCVRRRFHETEFRPAVALDWPGALFSLIRLPRLDGPGYAFDGSHMTIEAVADLDVAAVLAPRKRQPRPTQVELIPIDPTWPPPVTTEANDAAA